MAVSTKKIKGHRGFTAWILVVLGIFFLALILRGFYLYEYAKSPHWDLLTLDPNVHDLLARATAEEVAFDEVADRLVMMLRQTAAPEVAALEITRTGTFGTTSADQATALSMALVELLANAVEHGAGPVQLHSERDAEGLHVVVSDGGPGFPEGFSLAESPRLGLRIVDTLVTEELRGSLVIRRAGERTEVALDLGAIVA